jgi:prepilin-type N-terminal cleavage/methylation domain-containing protein
LLPFRRAAFTLVEMLVSLAVLAVALAVVGVVFSVTTRTASQSAAYAEVHGRVREFVRQIKEDLNACNPAESVLVLVGRTQAASLTQPDLEAGKFHRTLLGDPAAVADYDPEYAPAIDPNGVYSDPRADLLMFFTNRPTPSAAVDPNDPNIATSPYALGVKFSPIRVVYGHAAIAQPQWIGTTYTFPLSGAAPPAMQHIEQTITVSGRVMSRLPANRWHLARTAAILADPNRAPLLPDDIQFSSLACDALARGEPYFDNGYLPGDAGWLNVAEVLRSFGPTYFGVDNAPYLSPYGWPPAGNPHGNWQGWNQDSVNSLVFATGTTDPNAGPNQLLHVATVLDEVPVDLKSNLAVQMLPGCAWFQVEFLMPEDPRNSVTYAWNPTQSGMSRRSDMPRWTQVTPGSTYVFVPDTQANRDAVVSDLSGGTRIWDYGRKDQTAANDPNDAIGQRIVRMWPYAIRVTVRAWDSRGVLPEPIVRSVVHRFE